MTDLGRQPQRRLPPTGTPGDAFGAVPAAQAGTGQASQASQTSQASQANTTSTINTTSTSTTNAGSRGQQPVINTPSFQTQPQLAMSPTSFLIREQMQHPEQYLSRPESRRVRHTPQHSGVRYKKLPAEFIYCKREDLIAIVARMLSSLIEINDKQKAPNLRYIDHGSLTRFHSRSPPQISVYNYLLRLAHYSSLEPSVLITAVYYIDLLTLCYPVFALNSLTVHRFLLTATTVGSKSLCDSFCSNHHYAKVGGVNAMELNLLEAEFLTKVNYRVVPRDFNSDMGEGRRSSTGTLDSDGKTSSMNSGMPRGGGISSAAEVLQVYYRRMVMLVGGLQSDGQDHNTINVGQNDNTVYYLHDEDVISDQGDARGFTEEQYFGFFQSDLPGRAQSENGESEDLDMNPTQQQEIVPQIPHRPIQTAGTRNISNNSNQSYNGYVDSSTDYDSSSISDSPVPPAPSQRQQLQQQQQPQQQQQQLQQQQDHHPQSVHSFQSDTASRKRAAEGNSDDETEPCSTPTAKKMR